MSRKTEGFSPNHSRLTTHDSRIRVLFLCTGNSCRSQMAEGLLRAKAGDRYDVASAGTKPAGLNPDAVAAMLEVQIDISRQRSKPIDELAGQRFDYVITVCDRAKEACPIYPAGITLLHWNFDDPAAVQGTVEERREVFRLVRNEIAARIAEFVRLV